MKKLETPVLLLAGYLGSGKTTLLNRILANEEGIRFAVIVNDIGEVNIDAALIQKGGVVTQKDDSLVALQNGCICCTLKMDLVEQLSDIIAMQKFDYIVIEASGICEPAPIAQTICSIPRMEEKYTEHGVPRLDCICSVVDASRLQDEFACGDALTRENLDEEDIENLIIQQIEFCNIILLNKAYEVSPDELLRIRRILRAIQPHAEIIDCNYCDVDLNKLLYTHLFNFGRVANSAAWIEALDAEVTDDDHDDNHDHDHDHDHDDDHDHDHDHEVHSHSHSHSHDHDHGHGEVEEYNIGTYVYYRRPAFDLNKFDRFIAQKWSKNIIRAKGVCYFKQNPDMSYLFEQAGKQKKLTEAGMWYATAPEEQLMQFFKEEPGLLRDWDDQYGDRMQKIVFIGQNLDKKQIAADLDACLS